MNREEFLTTVTKTVVSSDVLERIHHIYGCVLPNEVAQVLCVNQSGCFLDGNPFRRLLSLEEVANAAAELHVNFAAHGVVPLFDADDNNFIVFDFIHGQWKKFNIVDETSYGTKSSLQDIL